MATVSFCALGRAFGRTERWCGPRERFAFAPAQGARKILLFRA